MAKTLDEIRRAGLEALARELGTLGMVRFLQLFESGSGDYTKERQTLFGAESVAAISAKVKATRGS